MVKEPKNIDFTTTGRELSTEEFALISEWIKGEKEAKMQSEVKPKIKPTKVKMFPAGATTSTNEQGHPNDPFFQKKAAASKEKLDKVGFPKEFLLKK